MCATIQKVEAWARDIADGEEAMIDIINSLSLTEKQFGAIYRERSSCALWIA